MIWISIIIPVYNFGKYIERTLKSVINQPLFNQCEIQIINDGSTDNTEQVCTNYVNKYDNIYLHNQTNQGVSVARNVGIQQSIGKYILFLDADDSIVEDFLSSDLIDIIQEDYDVIMFNGYTSNIKRNRYNVSTHYKDGERKGRRPFYIPGSFSSCLFKRDMIVNNNLHFDEHIRIEEDRIFTMQVMYVAKWIKTCCSFCHIYNKNPDSAMSNLTISKQYDTVKAWYILYEWLEENAVENKKMMLGFTQFRINSRIVLYAVNYAAICHSKKQLYNELKQCGIYDIINKLKPNEITTSLIKDLERYNKNINLFILHAKIEHWKVKYGRIALRISMVRQWYDKKKYPYTVISKYGPIK